MTLNIAHRGFSGEYPENTMLAFKKASETHCNGIETDVQLTKDGIPVLIHDETLDRTSNGTGLVKDYTYSELLKLDFGNGQKIPALEDFIAFSKEKNLFINLELKNSIIEYESLESITLNLLDKYSYPKDKVILSSFNHYSMVNIKTLDKSYKTGLLYDCWIYEPGNYCRLCGADAMHPQFLSVLNKKLVDDIKIKDFQINTYTVNDAEYMKKLLNLGIDGIITNYPDLLNQIMQQS
ncbi:glycerophosphodiester phosphodiesterase [Clostridium folliculivorans]|uniref:Glycerophosphoryl diester phosphodiesterase n=1 Tax=Clostridium folliculivorans TaxID=2886038 RepID=A0A9W5Y385_9CLOT|nr:glycerophosphodiester phosphodiesterase [Clostridium folliculivorans]GKU25798.1 glycerophosphoryl diester phosphodiesterase [Clostridium folliculivorans]GKU28819.1 glycerophosphoryl diester phosphodiesterase [Clostridium folliculivorans]